MAAEVEPERLVLHRTRDAADHVIGFQHGDAGLGSFRQLVGRRQTRGTGADDDDPIAWTNRRHRSRRRVSG
jgi:hypothetical protein